MRRFQCSETPHMLRASRFLRSPEGSLPDGRGQPFLRFLLPASVVIPHPADRLSRLTSGDWEKLKAEIKAKGVKVVALDLPTSWGMLTATADDFTGRMFTAINDMLLDMLAAIAHKDYLDRRRRTTEGIKKAAQAGLLKGKPEDTERNARIAERLNAGASWSDIQKLEGCSRDTVARIAKRIKETTAHG